MKVNFYCAFLKVLSIVLAVLFSLSAVAKNDYVKGQAYVDGQLIVKRKNSNYPASYQGKVFKNAGHFKSQKSKMDLIEFDKNSTSFKTLKTELEADPSVLYVQRNYYYRIKSLPNDTEFSKQWSLNNTGQSSEGEYPFNNPGRSGFDIFSDEAWDHVTNCSSAPIAIVDTGVNYTHQDLAANMWSNGAYRHHGYNYIEGNDDPLDYSGHGTHVAGIVGAVGNNGVGTSGVCWRASLMALKALDNEGVGTSESIAASIEFAAKSGAKVINLSIGGPHYDPLIFDSIKLAQGLDVLVVAAAGNEDGDLDGSHSTYPCQYDLDNILCVGAVDQSFFLTDFTNYGVRDVDMVAPGANILSSWPGPMVLEDFSSGWQTPGQWRVDDCGSGNSLLHSVNGCSGGGYGNNLNQTAAKVLNASSYYGVVIDLGIEHDFESGDLLRFRSTPGSSPSTSGEIKEVYSGRKDSFDSFDLSEDCALGTCNLNFQFTSNSSNSGTPKGTDIYALEITLAETNSNATHTISGTSMATPIVSGVAGLVWSKNPNYTYKEVKSAVIFGGSYLSSLEGWTRFPSAVNAYGSVTYIDDPKDVTVQVIKKK